MTLDVRSPSDAMGDFAPGLEDGQGPEVGTHQLRNARVVVAGSDGKAVGVVEGPLRSRPGLHP